MEEDTSHAAPPTPPLPGSDPSPNAPFNRLSMPFPLRLPLFVLVSGSVWFGLGFSHGSTEAGLRFRAEHAHRLPDTQTGWYLYHKSKNYHVLLGGIKEGLRMSTKLGLWTGVFLGMEEGVDRGRASVVRSWRVVKGTEEEEGLVAGNRDFLSTVLAGLGTAGAFSVWHRFPSPTAARLARTGGKAGLVFGLLQDAASLLRGRRLGYVEFIKRHATGRTSGGDERIKEATVPG